MTIDVDYSAAVKNSWEMEDINASEGRVKLIEGETVQLYEVPAEIICPITKEIFIDPVILPTPSANTFEQAKVREHFERSLTCPLSREKISTRNVFLPSNRAIKTKVKEFHERTGPSQKVIASYNRLKINHLVLTVNFQKQGETNDTLVARNTELQRINRELVSKQNELEAANAQLQKKLDAAEVDILRAGAPFADFKRTLAQMIGARLPDNTAQDAPEQQQQQQQTSQKKQKVVEADSPGLAPRTPRGLLTCTRAAWCNKPDGHVGRCPLEPSKKS